MTLDQWHKLIEIIIGLSMYIGFGTIFLYYFWCKGCAEGEFKLRWVLTCFICVPFLFLALALIFTPTQEIGLWSHP